MHGLLDQRDAAHAARPPNKLRARHTSTSVRTRIVGHLYRRWVLRVSAHRVACAPTTLSRVRLVVRLTFAPCLPASLP